MWKNQQRNEKAFASVAVVVSIVFVCRQIEALLAHLRDATATASSGHLQ